MRKFFFASIIFFLFLGCQKRTEYIQYEWQKNVSTESLASVESQLSDKTFNEVEKIQIGKYRVESNVQAFEKVNLENSYLKRIFINDEVVVLAAKVAEVKSVSKLGNKTSKKIKELNSKVGLENVRSKFAFLAGKEIINHGWKYVLIDQNYQIGFFVNYFDNYSFYELLVDEKYELISNKKVGSSFDNLMASVFPEGPKQSALTQVLLSLKSFSPIFQNANLSVSSDYPIKFLSSEDLIKVQPTDLQFDQLQVFFYINKAFRWFEENLKTKLDYVLEVRTHVGYPDKINTAFYYQGKMRIGIGDDVNYKKIAHDPSIVIHETSHAFVDAIIGLPFEGEGGSINEALADFLTAMILDNPNMGEVSFLKGPYKRSLNTNKNLSEKNGLLYHDSLIVSGLLWDLKKVYNKKEIESFIVELMIRLNPSSNIDDVKIILNALIKQSEFSDKASIAEAVLRQRGWLL